MSLTPVLVQNRSQQDTFHERTGQKLNPEESRVFKKLVETEKYIKETKIKVNYIKKTKWV